MRVLALSLYGGLSASTRHRLLQYRSAWADAGIELTVAPLLGDAYLRSLFAEQRASRRMLARQALGRLYDTLRASRFELVIVAHELLPWAPGWLERLLRARGTPYVLDMDDATFHRYDDHPRGWVRRVYGGKMPSICAGASAVFAGSDYLVDWCRRWNDHVHLVPTQVDTRRYLPRPGGRARRPFTIGWMGSPSTAAFLPSITGALGRAQATLDARIVIVGGGSRRLPGVQAEYRSWTEPREVSDLQEMSVGIMPLVDSPFTRGKCAFKLIQYMACAVPVVASPIGMNTRLVTESGSGRLAGGEQDWLSAFTELAQDPEAADAKGLAGRRAVEEGYSLQRLAPRTAEWLYAARRRAQG